MRRLGGSRGRKGIAQIVGAVFLVVITVACAVTLYALRPAYPSDPITVGYLASETGNEPAWGDGSDCSNVNGVQTCLTLPAIYITLVSLSPANLAVANLLLVFYCNGTVYLSATLLAMEWVPGSTGTPGPTAPQLQKCGTYTPPNAAFNRFAYFRQLVTGAPDLRVGDTIVLYSHTFTGFKDDDFHGAPTWCYSVPGACTVVVYYLGPSPGTAIDLPLLGLSS